MRTRENTTTLYNAHTWAPIHFTAVPYDHIFTKKYIYSQEGSSKTQPIGEIFLKRPTMFALNLGVYIRHTHNQLVAMVAACGGNSSRHPPTPKAPTGTHSPPPPAPPTLTCLVCVRAPALRKHACVHAHMDGDGLLCVRAFISGESPARWPCKRHRAIACARVRCWRRCEALGWCSLTTAISPALNRECRHSRSHSHAIRTLTTHYILSRSPSLVLWVRMCDCVVPKSTSTDV